KLAIAPPVGAPIIPILNYTTCEHPYQVADDKTFLGRNRTWRRGTVPIPGCVRGRGGRLSAPGGPSWVEPPSRLLAGQFPLGNASGGEGAVMFGRAFAECCHPIPGVPGSELSGDLRFRGPGGSTRSQAESDGRSAANVARWHEGRSSRRRARGNPDGASV